MDFEKIPGKLTRADFLKLLGLGAATLAIPSWASGAATQATEQEGVAPSTYFTLNKVAPLIASYRLDAGAFEPAGSWSHTYHMFSLGGGNVSHQGELVLKRTPTGARRFELALDCRRSASAPYSYFVHAKYQCTADALATPMSWTSEGKLVLKGPDAPYWNSDYHQQATVSATDIHLTTNETKRVLPCPQAFTQNWCLLEAVQRLPGATTRPIKFTLFDESDQVKLHQRLSYRTRGTIALGDGAHKLTAYQQVGQGVLPFVYWVDESGRLLFAMSGPQIYVLQQADSVTATFKVDPHMNKQRGL